MNAQRELLGEPPGRSPRITSTKRNAQRELEEKSHQTIKGIPRRCSWRNLQTKLLEEHSRKNLWGNLPIEHLEYSPEAIPGEIPIDNGLGNPLERTSRIISSGISRGNSLRNPQWELLEKYPEESPEGDSRGISNGNSKGNFLMEPMEEFPEGTPGRIFRRNPRKNPQRESLEKSPEGSTAGIPKKSSWNNFYRNLQDPEGILEKSPQGTVEESLKRNPRGIPRGNS